MRSRESLKNALMVQSGWYDDLQTEVNGATQKKVDESLNAANCRALEGGYMSTKELTYIRKSSIYLTDAISTESFVNETRFHNNLYLAGNYAKANGLNLQNKAGDVGLMPYQYEYDKSLKVYSLTIDLEMVGIDENFNAEADNNEKVARIEALLDAVQTLSLIVKGNLDNAEPIFIVGGLSDRKTHYFENVVHVENNQLVISESFQDKIAKGYHCGLQKGGALDNEKTIEEVLKSKSVEKFFEQLKADVREYYNVTKK